MGKLSDKMRDTVRKGMNLIEIKNTETIIIVNGENIDPKSERGKKIQKEASATLEKGMAELDKAMKEMDDMFKKVF